MVTFLQFELKAANKFELFLELSFLWATECFKASDALLLLLAACFMQKLKLFKAQEVALELGMLTGSFAVVVAVDVFGYFELAFLF